MTLRRANRIGTVIAMALLLLGGAAMPVRAVARTSTFRFNLPGGAAIIYSKALNPQAPLSQRSWRQAVFQFPNGTTFSLSDYGAEMWPPSDNDISPSGQYVVVERIESNAVSFGPTQPESYINREYCLAIEIRTGCITADQTGEICGAGWEADRKAQWGTDDQTWLMLTSGRPSSSELLRFINAGQPVQASIDDDGGTDNILRCDPPSLVNRDAYRKIASALHATGAHNDARMIEAAINKEDGGTVGTLVPSVVETGHHTATVSVQKAMLYTEPDEAHVSRAYLVRNDVVTVLKQVPAGWAYVDYVNAAGKHLLRWVKVGQLVIAP
jgi:hypothetical protein